MAGLLNRLSTDPLFNVGLGLLQAGSPSRNPAAASPWGYGITSGLLASQQARAAQAEAAQRQQQMQLKQMQIMQQLRDARMKEAQAQQIESQINMLESTGKINQEQAAYFRMNPEKFVELRLKNMQPQERKYEKDLSGRLRYVDTGQPVFPNVEAPEKGYFEGTGIEAQALNAYLESLPPEQRDAEALRLSKQRLTQPQTLVTPQGTYTRPGYSIGSTPTAPAGGVSGAPSGFIPKPETEREQTVKYVSGQLHAHRQRADEILARAGFDPTKSENMAANLPLVGNFLASEDYQAYKATANEWTTNLVFLRSGATARKEEVDAAFQNYWPQPGDKPRTVDDKRLMRLEQELQALQFGMQEGRIAPESAKQEIAQVKQDLTSAREQYKQKYGEKKRDIYEEYGLKRPPE